MADTALLRAAVESANDAVIITEARLDHPGPRVEYVNPAYCRMTGWSLEETIGATPRVLQGPKTSRALLERLKRDLATTRQFVGETTNYRKDGTEYEVEWRITPLCDDAGTVLKWVAVQRDVTERKRADQEREALVLALREQDKRKDEFLATLAHELRNPLAPLRTGLEVLNHDPGGSAGRAAREMMARQLGHMVRLVDDLLDVSRVSRGAVSLQKSRTDIRAVAETAVEAARPLIEAGGHKLEVELPGAPLELDADPTRLAQVVGNLLANAAKYTPPGGSIRLSAARAGGDIVLAVADTGVGIPPDMLTKVFDIFTQVGQSIERSQGGLGIGLALVKRLVEMHGGTASAASAGAGRGSVFTVRLPLVSGATAEHAGAHPGVRYPARPARRRVLVVDDNVDAAESLALLLGLDGHETAVAHDGPAALELACRFAPEVVFLDLGLPAMNGYEVAKRFRAEPGRAGVLLVALTGWGAEEDRRRSKEAGFDHHLTKPAESERIRELLAAR